MNKHFPDSKSARTRTFIIEKTANIFNTKGYAGTSISDLTSATMLTKGSIYGNFKNKDEIALAAFEYNVRRITDAFSDEIEAAATAIDKLLVYPKIFRNLYKGIVASGGCPILNTLVESDDTHPALKAAALSAIKRWKAGIIRIIKEGMKKKELPPSIDPNRYAENILSLFEGGGILAKATGLDSFMHNALDHVEELIVSLKT